MAKRQVYYTNIWEEEAEADNPFATKAAYCHGYDVYGEILQKASWFEYLYLMFKGERPSEQQAKLLEKLAMALMNPGPREASVRAAMNGGVGGSTHASSLMAALAVGAGQYGGSHELFLLMQAWDKFGCDKDQWITYLKSPNEDYREDIWDPVEHAPGFDINATSCNRSLITILETLVAISPQGALNWLSENRKQFESEVGYPLSITGIVSAAFFDLGFDEHSASMLFLMLRLPGAAAHAVEQRGFGWKKFPFYADNIELEDDPGYMGMPKVKGVSL